ncbi:MAG: translational machinery protein [Myxococcaceae bacterium]|nr:translational machinery protein [Myxococcaceae bacterium]
MMNCQHAAVWIDHAEAKLFALNLETFDTTTVQAPHHHVHRHPTRTREAQHPVDDQHFFHDVVRGLDGAEEILVVGPANAKLEFMKHVKKHDPALEAKIVGVENSDHPTEGQIVAFARDYFRAADRMRGNAP